MQKGEITLDYSDQAEPKWKLAEDRRFTDDGKWKPVKLKADEELNTTKLDGLKTALDDLKIVDVVPKPQGLSADLKASADFMKKEDSLLTLQSRGFFPAKLDQQIELFSKEGEVRSLMKDGVEYVLRFGDITARGETAQAKEDEKDKEQKEGQNKETKKSSTGQNRYLFVMAEFNPEVIPKPKLDPLPEAKPEAENKPAPESKQPAKPEEKSAQSKDAAKPAEKETVAKEKEAAKPAEKAAESKENPVSEKNEVAAEKKEKPGEKLAEKPSLEAQRQQVEKENKRKQEEYEAKLAAGKKHAEELNARFADWYYIISDDVYRKIRLGHDDIVKKKRKRTPRPAINPATKNYLPPIRR